MRPDSIMLSPGGELLDELPFKPVRVAVITLSDTRTLETDASGALLAKRLVSDWRPLAARVVVKDDVTEIRAAVHQLAHSGDVDVMLMTGGTGMTARASTILQRSLIEREKDLPSCA